MSRLRYIRERVLKLTQAELAMELNIRQPSVSILERTDRFHHHMPRIREIAKERGLVWSDSLFFDPLPTPTKSEDVAA